MTEQERRPSEASELEGGGTEQTWGQGEGRHETDQGHGKSEQSMAQHP